MACSMIKPHFVMPAKAGISLISTARVPNETPAFAGVTAEVQP